MRAITQFDNPSRIRFVVLRLPNHGTRGSARTFILSEAGVGIVHVVIGTALAIRFVGFGHRLIVGLRISNAHGVTSLGDVTRVFVRTHVARQ